MPEYLFDVKLFAAFRVTAPTEKEARSFLAYHLDCATVEVPSETPGSPILKGEASPDGYPALMEIDGKDVE